MDRLKLHFVGDDDPSLFQTEYICGGRSIHAVRGKTSGAFTGQGSFHWSIAVRALSVLAIRTAMSTLGHSHDPILVGDKGSLAASLDYAISKETHWLIDIFGLSEGDLPNFRRIFKRTNSGRKRSGPVAVSLSKPFLQSGAIAIRLNSNDLVTVQDLETLVQRVSDVELPLLA
ncbi:MAG: hypothetical protein RL518_1909 [Pseudomonadota bacterium]|jgi:hypothetical protein